MSIYLMPSIIILIALIFEFSNGFHDTSNAVATSIATKSLEPFQAISISAIFNLIGAISGTAVAVTIAKGFADPKLATDVVILSALLSAIVWNLATWATGMPSSSSHAIIGGLIGGVAFNSGWDNVKYLAVLYKVIIPMVVSPILGFVFATIVVVMLSKFFSKSTHPRTINNKIREIQVLSTAFLSFSHGSGDAQKTMGIITLTLFNFHLISTVAVPTWVIFLCALCMALGTFAGGMRIVRTLSTKVAKLKPVNGFAAEITSATVLFIGARLGIPLSTTHAVSGSIMGAGTTSKLGLNWAIVRNMFVAWIFTLPMCTLLSGIFLHIIKILAGSHL